MNVFSKSISSIILTLMFTLGIVGTTAVATPKPVYASNLGGVMDSITNSSNTVIGSNTKKRVQGLSREIQEIILVIVMAILLCSGLWHGISFATAGDDSKKKGEIKNKLLFLVLGVVFLTSYYAFLKFGFINLKLFG